MATLGALSWAFREGLGSLGGNLWFDQGRESLVSDLFFLQGPNLSCETSGVPGKR